MKPHVHALSSVRKWGGSAEDYQPIHDWLDSSKAIIPDMRHRLIYHNSQGPFLAEQIFGRRIINAEGIETRQTYITNADGRRVQIRDIVERHILEDLGRIPTAAECFGLLPQVAWVGGPKKRVRLILFDGAELLLSPAELTTAIQVD